MLYIYIYMYICYTSILAKLSTWSFEHSGDISCSFLVNPSHTESPGKDETRVCGHIYLYIYIYICIMYIYNIYTYSF